MIYLLFFISIFNGITKCLVFQDGFATSSKYTDGNKFILVDVELDTVEEDRCEEQRTQTTIFFIQIWSYVELLGTNVEVVRRGIGLRRNN